MKILRVINSLEIGGAERSIATNVPLHKQNGFDIDVLLLNGKKTFFSEQLEQQGVKIITLQNVSLYSPIILLKLIKLIKKYDIIHAHLFPSLYWVALANFFCLKKKKILFTEHSTYNRRRSIWWLKPLDKWIYKQYSKIICITDEANIALSNYLHYDTIVTINNGVNIKQLQEETLFKIEGFKLDSNQKILLQIAGFRDEKDQDTLIKALTLLPINFIIVFIGDGKRKQECIDLAKSLHVDGRVFFMGIQQKVGVYIKLAEVVVMSSHWEGFGRAAVEAMALEKPVVASDVAGLSKVVGGAGLLFEAGNYKELASKILELSENKYYYNQVAKKCLERALEYDVKKMVLAYENIYISLSNNK